MKDDRYEKQLLYYHKAVALTEAFAEWIRSNTAYKCKVEYMFGYFSYFGFTNINEPQIKLLNVPFENCSVAICSMIAESEDPYIFHCWWYGAGEGLDKHHFYSLRFREVFEKDFPEMWRLACRFFGFSTVQYEQISLFDALGVL